MNAQTLMHRIWYTVWGASAVLGLALIGAAAHDQIRPLELPNFNDIRVSGSNVIIFWYAGSLQAAPDLRGPWFDVPSATSPYTNSVAGTDRQFYRLKMP